MYSAVGLEYTEMIKNKWIYILKKTIWHKLEISIKTIIKCM